MTPDLIKVKVPKHAAGKVSHYFEIDARGSDRGQVFHRCVREYVDSMPSELRRGSLFKHVSSEIVA